MRRSSTQRDWIGGAVIAVALLVFGGCGTQSDETAANVPPRPEIAEDEPLRPPDVSVDSETSTRLRLAASSDETAGDQAGSPPESVAATDPPPRPEVQPPDVPHADADLAVAPSDAAAAPETWKDWPDPECVLVVSGQQHGYIEPCGCTGLDRQKGGLMRRYTFLEQLRDRGWEVVPVDAGNQVRRSGRQAAIKFRTTVKGLTQMNYQAIGFGPDDLRLGASELLSVAASDGENDGAFASSNIELLAPDLVPTVQRIEAGGRTIGVTTALDPSTLDVPVDDAIIIGEMNEKITAALEQLKEQQCDFNVLLLFGKDDAARRIAREVPGFDLVVAAGNFGEPTYQAEEIEGTDSRLILTGDKGMHVGVIGLYPDGPFKYSRVALTHEYEDAPEMLELMAAYQDQLKALGLEGLGIRPIAHPTGREFVGSETCGECHTTAFEVWQDSHHALATEHIVHPGERSEIPRHHDPECISCHVTGWNPQGYYPYATGYLSLEETPALTGSGCENCHGPGNEHVAAERGEGELSDDQIEALRVAMRLPLDRARQKCLECHDLDNSPDFHVDDAFEEYWSQIEHYGMD